MLLPAYLFKAGLGSKLSTWLTPPHRKIQITDLALAGKCGLPSGGAEAEGGENSKTLLQPRHFASRVERLTSSARTFALQDGHWICTLWSIPPSTTPAGVWVGRSPSAPPRIRSSDPLLMKPDGSIQ